MELRAEERVHLALLERWRKALDLVGPGPLEPHFDDAAQAVSWIKHPGDWADLGSGAGFPGISLASRHADFRVFLVESRSKRATFLEQVVSESGLKNATIMRQRTEEIPDASFDGVISRAYKPPADYLVDAHRLLRPGGVAVLLLAQQEAPVVAGLEVFHVEHYRVDGRPRAAVGYRKLQT